MQSLSSSTSAKSRNGRQLQDEITKLCMGSECVQVYVYTYMCMHVRVYMYV